MLIERRLPLDQQDAAMRRVIKDLKLRKQEQQTKEAKDEIRSVRRRDHNPKQGEPI